MDGSRACRCGGCATACATDAGPGDRRRARGWPMAHVFGNAPGSPLFATRADYRQQCCASPSDVGLPAAGHRPAGGHADRGRRDDVRHVWSGDGRRAERPQRTAPLAVEPADCTKRVESGLPPRQPRCRHRRPHRLRRDARRLSGRPGRDLWQRTLERFRSRESDGARDHGGATRRRREDHRRHQRGRSRHSRLPRRVRCEERRASLAILDDSRNR